MTSIAKNSSTNSFGFSSSKILASQSTCNICKRPFNDYEELVRCSNCQSSSHQRCVESKTTTYDDDIDNYVCDKCNNDTITNSSQQLKATNSLDKNYRDFAAIPSKTLSTETNVGNAIRYFERKQQEAVTPTTTTQLNELDRYLPPNINEIEYQHHNGQDKSDSRTSQRIQQQHNDIGSDEENDSSAMFQANYQYTPLKEYAAMRNNRLTSDHTVLNYQTSPSDHQITSRYGGGLQYTNHGYDPTVSRLVEPPSSASIHIISPTMNHLSNQNHQRNFITTTNLHINEIAPPRQQQPSPPPPPLTSPSQSTPYSSQVHDTDTPIVVSPPHQHQNDRHSTVGSDSGIIITNPNTQKSKENPDVEKKLTSLIQQLGKQLENDAQKINGKLELKLKNLENMIHQQTHIIQRQDEVIERLKNKILEIETDRNQYHEKLLEHEQNETKTFIPNENGRTLTQDSTVTQSTESTRKYSITSTLTSDSNKKPIKKVPAPRIGHQWSATSDEIKPTVSKLITNTSTNRQRIPSDSSSVPSTIDKVTSVPLVESSAASSRLDNIIHPPDTKDVNSSLSSNYSLAQVRRQDRPQNVEPISMAQQQVITSVHHEASDDDDDKSVDAPKPKRFDSSTSSSSSSTQPISTSNTTRQPPPATTTTSAVNRNANVHRSFESLQAVYSNDQQSNVNNRTNSLEFDTKPVQYNDSKSSIYITPVEASQPAIQANSIVKGWLRKQNRDSFLKRIERYYCILTNDALLMHRNEHDRTPVKAINLKGAKVHYYDDARHGPSLELSWSSQLNDTKHYHFYAPNPQEAEQWVSGIQTTINNVNSKNQWEKYRLDN
ncbi:unnamed protein product [Adineta steineri]|uniref:PH domain-containing protein n=1 Tax=Adineta steineri TaxID=433720 RepID=A0A815L8H8_9BILA|nr:unnamed protein product [Adineta steineri]